MEPISGSCLCKGVQYCIPSKTSQWLRCHCSMCRKAIGAEHCTYFAVPVAKVEFKSKDTLKTFRSSEDAERSFCSNCGCSICMKYGVEKNTIWFNAATLDVKVPVVDPHQIFTKDKFEYLDVMAQSHGTPDISAWVVDSAKSLA
ncbi:uncharacterized lyase C29B12.13-like [Penaeus monodon]|uniref:uncharacterized lyase C29B12.13-like n=1 Tax=Penaeus monodon TaxID=6687 RepID=UPI0018A6E7BB|nr:uncharacterized lyase C29B12.13-like [Penaeus monodon]